MGSDQPFVLVETQGPGGDAKFFRQVGYRIGFPILQVRGVEFGMVGRLGHAPHIAYANVNVNPMNPGTACRNRGHGSTGQPRPKAAFFLAVQGDPDRLALALRLAQPFAFRGWSEHRNHPDLIAVFVIANRTESVSAQIAAAFIGSGQRHAADIRDDTGIDRGLLERRQLL